MKPAEFVESVKRTLGYAPGIHCRFATLYARLCKFYDSSPQNGIKMTLSGFSITEDNFKKGIFYGSDECLNDLQVCVNPTDLNATPTPEMQLIHALMGIRTEADELQNPIWRLIRRNEHLPVDIVNLKEELGDLLWYIGLACHCLGVTFEQLFDINCEKLKVRYPNKFTQDSAVNRNLEAERASLEQSASASVGSDLEPEEPIVKTPLTQPAEAKATVSYPESTEPESEFMGADCCVMTRRAHDEACKSLEMMRKAGMDTLVGSAQWYVEYFGSCIKIVGHRAEALEAMSDAEDDGNTVALFV